MKNPEKSKVYDVVKVITTVLVVVAHATRMYTPLGAFKPLNESKMLELLTEYIYIFHMPLFICVSGCVYGYNIELCKYNDNKDFFKKKIKRLLIPYYICGLLYVAPIMQLLKIDEQGYWQYCISGIILSYDSRHLWYIFALFWIFLIATLLKPFLNMKVGSIIIGIISLFLYRYGYFFPVEFQIQAACHYQLYFFAGILINHFYMKLSVVCKKYVLILTIFPFVLMLRFIWNPNSITNLLYISIGLAMTMGLAYWIVIKQEQLLYSKLYQFIKKNSFGIYLFHPMIIYVIFYWMSNYDINPIILSVLAIVFSIKVSIHITSMLRKIKLEMVIGEG